jgi:hypothetical protein
MNSPVPSSRHGSDAGKVAQLTARSAPGHLLRERVGAAAFLLPYFVATASTAPLTRHNIPTRFLEYAVLSILMIGALAAPTPRRRSRGFVGVSLLVLLVAVYAVARGHPRYGTTEQYLAAGLAFTVIYGFTILYARNLFSLNAFCETFWRFSVASLWIALLSYVSHKAFGDYYLVSVRLDTGIGRLQGFLSEPSAWAPVLTAMILLSIRRRSYGYLLLSLLGVVLTQSPTTFITAAITVPTYYVVISKWRRGKPVAIGLLVGSALAVIGFVRTADPSRYLESSNPIAHTIGRTLSGISNVTSGGAVGENARFSYLQTVLADIRGSGRTWLGFGPDASSVFFPAKYPLFTGLRPIGPASIWNRAWFEFGLIGMLFLIGVMVLAIVRSYKYPTLAAILLPFILSSCINEAGGHQLNKIVELAILLLAFGWLKPSENATGVAPSRTATRIVPPSRAIRGSEFEGAAARLPTGRPRYRSAPANQAVVRSS